MTPVTMAASAVRTRQQNKRDNPQPPRTITVRKRYVVVTIIAFLAFNAIRLPDGGVVGWALGEIWHNPFRTTATVVVPDVPRITSAIRNLDEYAETLHIYPVEFDFKEQRSCIGVNCGSAKRHYDGVGWARAGTHFKRVRVETVGQLANPTKSAWGQVHLIVELPYASIVSTGNGKHHIGGEDGTFAIAPDVPIDPITQTADEMVAQAASSDPTLLKEAQADIRQQVSGMVDQILRAVHYKAVVEINFVDPMELVPVDERH